MHIVRRPYGMEHTAALDFVASRGFGVVIATDGDRPMGSHVPLVIKTREEKTLLQFHLTAKNPLVELAAAGRRFLIVVSGSDCYVSNDWYVSKDQVSTWLYEAVHLSGPARLGELEENRPHGDALLAVSEARLPKTPWELAGMEPVKRQAMLDMIRVVEVRVDTIEGQSKLNQHKIDADHVAVANSLFAQSSTTAQALALKMRALRPHLAYSFPDS